MTGVIDRETATAEVESWFIAKKIKQSQKDSQKEAVEILIESVMDGDLSLNKETNVWTHKLSFPEAGIKELSYKPRVNDAMLKPYLEGNKPGNGQALILSYMCALTNTNKAILDKLDSQDKRIASSIVVFFL